MTDTLLSTLAHYRPFTAMVVGDFMLDEQVCGAAERLSPDAPVPVLHVATTSHAPGGASNVALCLAGLEGRVLCFGIVGDDAAARSLRSALHQAGCEVEGLLTDPPRPTTIKRSLIGLAQHRHPQKMFRMDIESREPLSATLEKALLEAMKRRVDEVDVICIEDYNKGVCSTWLCAEVIALGRRQGKPVLVDPAAIADYTRYRGATVITPNRSEAELATNLDTPLESSADHNEQMARRLLRDLALDAVVLTLDKSGALLATPGQTPLAVPTVARNVYDVTGAGDMVLAALAAGVANGMSWPDAVRFANAAAGLEVEVFGAQPIPFAKVHRSILALARNLEGKIRRLEDLLVELALHRHAGETIVLTNGCFDVIHAGHVAYLREAKKKGQVLVVAVNADSQVAILKGEGRPVYSEAERLEILAELTCIDYLVVFHEPTAHRVIEAIRPHVYVKGGDYAPEDVVEYDLLKPLMDRGELRFQTIAYRPGLSSTAVIERFSRAYGPAAAGTGE